MTGFSVSGPPAGSEARRTRGRAPTPDADIAAKLEDLGRTVLDMNKGAWHTAASLLDGAEARGLIPAGFADAYHRKLEGALDAAADAGRIERESDNEGHRILYRVPA